MHCDPTRPSQLRLRTEQVAWIHSRAQWTHAVTITFLRSQLGVAPSKVTACKAAKHLVNTLNRNLLGRGRVHRGHRIGSVAVFGTGPYGDHPHVHLAIAGPSGLPHETVTKEIYHAIHCARGLGRKLVIKPYKDVGWIHYMIDHCSDGFDVVLVPPATP